MPSHATKIASVRFTPGLGNAGDLDDTLYLCLMEELALGTLPAAALDKHMIVTDVAMRTAVAANPNATPPVEAVPAGGFIAIEIARKKSDFKTNPSKEDGITGYSPTLEVVVPRTDEFTSYTLRNLNGARVVLVFKDANGKRRIAANVLVSAEPMVNSSTNAYKLTFDFGSMPIEPYFYGGATPLRG